MNGITVFPILSHSYVNITSVAACQVHSSCVPSICTFGYIKGKELQSLSLKHAAIAFLQKKKVLKYLVFFKLHKPSACMRERVIVVILSVGLSHSDFGDY